MKVRSILLMQPNYGLLGKRRWEQMPYGLAILNACLADRYDTELFDPNFHNTSEEGIRAHLRASAPTIVGITTYSTEYLTEIRLHTAIVKDVLPNCIVVVGGIFPTALPETAIEDPNTDFCILGEGEYRFPSLLDVLERGNGDFESVNGIAFRRGGRPIVIPPHSFIDPLDQVPLPRYGNLDVTEYGNFHFQYAHGLIPRQFPFATLLTSRGCPFHCIFCAARTVSGAKVRLRSAHNVLDEIEDLTVRHGIKEVIFQDDHFLHSKRRAIQIAQGIKARWPGMTWKCGNLAVFSLTEELLEIMMACGSYQLTLSLENGNQDVLDNIIRKPVNLKKARAMVTAAKALGYEIVSNFVIGFPGETWEQIRQTFAFAESLELDLVNFHIATPLPNTRLMEICLQEGYLKPEDEALAGYTKGVISTSEFSSTDLQILRAYEWDRINFRTREKIAKIASMEGITEEEVSQWRASTRRNLGTTLKWNERV